MEDVSIMKEFFAKYKKMIVVLVAIILLAGIAFGSYTAYQRYTEYHATYIVIDEVEYLRSSTSLDLSGKTVTELDKLKELTGLQELDLRNTGLTPAQYENLHDALPGCRIHWSVPFQDGFVDNEAAGIKIDHLAESDLDTLEHLPYLTAVYADGCEDYDMLQLLAARYPDLTISYNVSLGGREYYNTINTLTVTDPDVTELMEDLALLPAVKTVTLNGTLPSNDELMKLREAYPEITFVWDFEVFGIPVNTLTEFIDLSGMTFESVEEVEAILPYFYNLTKVDMVKCGFSNEEMDALNKRHRDTKFVWTVNVCGVTLRTDATYFMPVKYKLTGISKAAMTNLKYCTDMLAIDLGHYGVHNVDYVEYMPNLEFLLLCECYISDLTAIGKCTSLKVLELFMNNVSDFWPLVNLTNLEDLNLAQTPEVKKSPHERGAFGDTQPLKQMVWLDRLWVSSTSIGKAARADLEESLPDTVVVNGGANLDCTGRGWRMSPNYFEMRDVVGMWYMAH